MIEGLLILAIGIAILLYIDNKDKEKIIDRQASHIRFLTRTPNEKDIQESKQISDDYFYGEIVRLIFCEDEYLFPDQDSYVKEKAKKIFLEKYGYEYKETSELAQIINKAYEYSLESRDSEVSIKTIMKTFNFPRHEAVDFFQRWKAFYSKNPQINNCFLKSPNNVQVLTVEQFREEMDVQVLFLKKDEETNLTYFECNKENIRGMSLSNTIPQHPMIVKLVTANLDTLWILCEEEQNNIVSTLAVF